MPCGSVGFYRVADHCQPCTCDINGADKDTICESDGTCICNVSYTFFIKLILYNYCSHHYQHITQQAN